MSCYHTLVTSHHRALSSAEKLQAFTEEYEIFFLNLPLALLLSAQAIGAGGLGFDSRATQIGQCRQRLATTVTFLRRCDVQALSCGDGAATRLLTLVKYREYNEDFI